MPNSKQTPPSPRTAAEKPDGSSSLLIHLSDLHFGKILPDIADALIDDLTRQSPDLVVVSGDFTMRARLREFQDAKDFLEKLPCPWVAVPGNHDLPAWGLRSRFLTPFARYRSYICEELQPRIETKRFALFGLNSARRLQWNSLDWSRGRVNKSQLEEMTRWFETCPARKPRIVVTHHPFALPPASLKRGSIGRLSRALESFRDSGVCLLLAGHLHQTYWSKIPSSPGQAPILALQASTATSTRLKGEPNAYNAITLQRDHMKIDLRAWDGKSFVAGKTLSHQIGPLRPSAP